MKLALGAFNVAVMNTGVHDRQVRRTVVVLDAVDVVDRLGLHQVTPDQLFGNEPMLRDKPVFDSVRVFRRVDVDVSVVKVSALRVSLRPENVPVLAHALLRAVPTASVFRGGGPTSGYLKFLAALVAGASHLLRVVREEAFARAEFVDFQLGRLGALEAVTHA